MRIIKIFCLIFLLLYSFSLISKEKEYEYWGDSYFEGKTDTLNSIDLDSILTDYDKNFSIFNISAGFFPKPYLDFAINFSESDNLADYNVGNIALTNEISYLSNIFSTKPPAKNFNNKIEEKGKFSDENKYKWHQNPPNATYFLNLTFEKSFPELHTILIGSIGFRKDILKLYSPIYKNYFSQYDGSKKQFEECNVLEIEDKSAVASISMRHPIYGFSFGNGTFSSFYYLSYGILCSYSLHNNLYSYNYIISSAEDVRYSNGEIKESVPYKPFLPTIEKLRYGCIVSLGWTTTLDNVSIGYELKYSYALNSFFKEENIRRSSLSFSTYINLTVLLRFFELFILKT
jgi:hypothetical protein